MSGQRRSSAKEVQQHVADWRRATARLQLLLNTGAGGQALTDEAPSLRHQCERLAAELARCLPEDRDPWR